MNGWTSSQVICQNWLYNCKSKKEKVFYLKSKLCHLVIFIHPKLLITQAILEEFEDKLEQAHTKGLDQQDTEGKASTKSSVCVKAAGKGAAKKTPRKYSAGLFIVCGLNVY